MSPAQAAHISGVSRRTIMRAIETHDLKAFRDNKNHWKITGEELQRWAIAHCATTEQSPTQAPITPTPETQDFIVELRIAQTENRALRDRIKDLEADRDSWKSMAEKLAEKPRKFRWPWVR